MDTHFIFEQVQKMRPSSFTEEERHRYKTEKMMLRQFMILEREDQVPGYLTVKDMKQWLRRERTFQQEFQEIIEKTGIQFLFMAELAWTTARHFCLNQMEQELLEELDQEKQLSKLLGRNTTLVGLDMFVSVIRPGAEEDVQASLSSLHINLLHIFNGINLTRDPLSEGDTKPAELLQLQQITAHLVVDTALKFLLEYSEQKNKTEAASAEIAKLLTKSVAPCLSQNRSISRLFVSGICMIAARSMVKTVYKRFDEHCKVFNLMDYDDSFFSARQHVISAISHMDPKAQAESCKDHIELSTSQQPKDQLLEKRTASPQAADMKELKEHLMEKREASPGLSENEEVAITQSDVAMDTPLVRLETNVIVYIEDKLEVLCQEEVETPETQESLVLDFNVKKKKGAKALFRGLWKTMTCCFHSSTKD